MQEQFTVLTGSPAPRRDALGAAQAEKLPHLRLVNASAAEARNLFRRCRRCARTTTSSPAPSPRPRCACTSSDTPTATVLADLQRTLERQIPLK